MMCLLLLLGESFCVVLTLSFLLPYHRDDHALAMAKFSRSMVGKFNELVGTLETTLGPDTADLGIRVGMHSGPGTSSSIECFERLNG